MSMDPLRKMMHKYSQGRRSSVDPIRIQMDESCLTNTVHKKPRSGIPMLQASSMRKRRSSSCDRSHFAVNSNWSAAKASDRNNSAGLLFTPQNVVTPRMSHTARAAVDCISQLSIKSQTARKDNRSISDKTVQIRLARHVCSYLNKTGLVGDLLKGGQSTAPSEAIQPAALKNMNKNAFINLFNLLYKELGAKGKIDVNSNDYQERIPGIARKMGYPGIINKSHLLTPSSPHSWPYIIGFLAWIVDLVESIGVYENIVADESNIPLAYLRYHLSAYVAYNKKETPGPPPPALLETFKEKLLTLREVEPHVMDEIREEHKRYSSQLEEEMSNQKQLEELLRRTEDERDTLSKQVEETANCMKEWDGKIALVMDERRKCEEYKRQMAVKIEELRKEKEMLAVVCSQQKMSKEEWDTLRCETKELEANVKTIVEAIDNIKMTIDKTDLQISAKRNKLSKLWMKFMNATAPMQPDILSVKMFLDEIGNFSPMVPDALQSFKQIEDSLQHAHAEIVAKVSHDQSKAQTLQDQIHQMSLKYKDIRKEHECLKMQCKEKKKIIESLQKSFVKEEEEFNKKVEAVEMEIKRIQCVVTNDDMQDELCKLKEVAKKKTEELDELKKKSIIYFKERQEMCVSYHKTVKEKLQSFYSELEAITKELME